MSDPDAKPAQSVLPLVEGQAVSGTLFSEPIRVETIRENDPGTWVVGLRGLSTERFRKVTLSATDLAKLQGAFGLEYSPSLDDEPSLRQSLADLQKQRVLGA